MSMLGPSFVYPPAGVQATEFLSGNNVVIANNATGTLTWDTKVAGADLLNLSVPDTPRMVATGVYAVSVYVERTAPCTAGGFINFQLNCDYDGVNSSDMQAEFSGPIGGDGALTCISFIPAGGWLYAGVTNKDGVSSRTFFLRRATVQRII